MRKTLPRVRALTLAGGGALGGALLLGLALLGGVGDAPIPFQERAPDRRGPVSATQPELRRALLTGEDLPPAPVPSEAPAEPAAPAVIAPTPSEAAGAGNPEIGALADLCRFLFEDGAALAGLWPTAPQEITSRHTVRRGGGTLDQVLGVFDGEGSVEAYRRLRQSTGGCERFQAKPTGGSPVTILLRELTLDRAESGTADDSYIVLLTMEDGTPAGWLSVDRIGPVVSVLRHLGRSGDPDDIARTRHTALHKLEALLRTLRG